MAKALRFVLLIAAATVALLVVPASTADHRDAPGVDEDPRADINDIYAFINPNSGNVVLAMTVNPFQIGGAPAIPFGQDVLYEFKIDNDGDNVEDLVVQTTFTPLNPGPQRFNVRGPAKPRTAGTASSLLLETAPVISGPATGPSSPRVAAPCSRRSPARATIRSSSIRSSGSASSASHRAVR